IPAILLGSNTICFDKFGALYFCSNTYLLVFLLLSIVTDTVASYELIFKIYSSISSIFLLLIVLPISKFLSLFFRKNIKKIKKANKMIAIPIYVFLFFNLCIIFTPPIQ